MNKVAVVAKAKSSVQPDWRITPVPPPPEDELDEEELLLDEDEELDEEPPDELELLDDELLDEEPLQASVARPLPAPMTARRPDLMQAGESTE